MKNTILISAPKEYATTTKMILEEARKQFNVFFTSLFGFTIQIKKGSVVLDYEGLDIDKVEYFLPKIDSKRASYGYKIVKAFDALGIPHPYPAETLLVAHDKFLTTELLARHNISVPNTYILKTMENFEELMGKIKFPTMVKLMSGSGGKGIMYVESPEQMKAVCASMEALNQEVLVQEYIENPGEDLRVLVLGGQIAAAMKRIAPKGEKRANVSGGGKGILYEPTDDVAELAIKTAETAKAEILAVDIIDGNPPTVIEINVNPGIVGLSKATDRNIAKLIVDYIQGEIKK